MAMQTESSVSLDRDALLDSYRRMCTIREFEDVIHRNNALGKVPGFIHLSAGQEASAVGICSHLDDKDYISSTHRGHGHAIAKGCDVRQMMHEIYAKRTGICGGKAGSMHIADFSKGMLGANGIVGAGVPLANGAALTARVKGNNGVGLAFFGDGAFNEGATLETLNLAKVWNLPMVFVLENNGYGEATPASWAIGGDIEARATGFGLPYVAADGQDFFAVHEAAGKVIAAARSGGGPQFLEVSVCRYYGHFEGDAATYRSQDEVDSVRDERDCLSLFKQRVVSEGLIDKDELEAIGTEVKSFIDECVADAESAPAPLPADLLADVYSNY
jgi:acetoin:2,6-dichlorophenolindophenol oxidoreductase subunit alpha